VGAFPLRAALALVGLLSVEPETTFALAESRAVVSRPAGQTADVPFLPRADSTHSRTLSVAADTYVDSCTVSSNYGKADLVYVYNDYTEFVCEAWALLAFDLNGYPAGAIFRSATLLMRPHGIYSGTGDKTLGIFAAGTSWNESTVNWKTRPNALPYVDYVAADTSTGWHKYDASTVVERWLVSGTPNHGFVIKPSTSGSWMRSYSTREYSVDLGAQLVINYDMPTATPTRTFTRTRTRTRTRTPTRTNTVTPTRTRTPTSVPTTTRTPTATRSRTPTGVPTGTRTVTATQTRSATSTRTPTRVPTATEAATSTRTPTPRPTATLTPSRTPGGVRADYLLPAIADAYVNQPNLAWNYGTEFSLLVGTGPEPGEFYQLTRSFLRFDYSPLPADAAVESAVLHIYARDLYAAGENDTAELALYRIYEPWEESGKLVGITWDNQPEAVLVGSQVIDTATGWKTLDVTDMFRHWMSGALPNYGLMLRAANESGILFECEFFSRESTRCTPYVELTYTTEETPPESPLPPECGAPTDTTPPTLTLTADPDPATAGSPVLVRAVAEDSGGVYRLQLLRHIWKAGEVDSDGGAPELVVSGAFTLEPGMHAFSARAWDIEMNVSATAVLLRVYNDGQPPLIRVEHTPRNPRVGEIVTFTASAEDESLVNHITIYVNGRPFDRHFDPPDASPDFSLRYDEATIGFEPSGIRVLRYRAWAQDEEGLSASTGTSYALFGNTGVDDDGDGLSTEIESLLGTATHRNDTDNDGLYDGWEVLGVDRNGDGEIDIDLPAMGATPFQKDIFVEMDWVEDGADSYLYHPLGLQGVINSYLDYSLDLHIDTGQFGGGNPLPFDAVADDNWYFETKSENFALERYGIFYYTAISPAPDANRYGGKYMSGGHIFLRRKSPAGATPAKDAVFFNHELGHAMELGHGGQKSLAAPRRASTLGPDGELTEIDVYWDWENENSKINHLSNMNYRYQTYLRVRPDSGNDVYIYSYYALPDSILDENDLDEDLGWVAEARLGTYVWRAEDPGVEPDAGEWVLLREALHGWYYVLPGKKECAHWWLADGSWIDWNRNGTHEDEPYAWDINPETCAEPTAITELEARYEVPLLRPKIYGDIYRGPAERAGGSGGAAEIHWDEEVELATDGEYGDGVDNDGDGLVDEGFADSDRDGIADPIDNCVLTYNPDQLDADRNWIGDACADPPVTPASLRARLKNGAPLVEWTASEEDKVIGYNVYRRRAGETDFTRLGRSYPTTLAPVFVDESCSGETIYTVTAVDLYLNESDRVESVSACACEGDCDGNGTVDVSELLRGVNISLGTSGVTACPSFDASGDGEVTVDELIRAVNNALVGC